jgi:hypothetical protein
MNEWFMNSLECESGDITLYEKTGSINLQRAVDNVETKQYSRGV